MIYVTSYKKSITQQTIWTIRHQDSLQEQLAGVKKVIIERKGNITQCRGLASHRGVLSLLLLSTVTQYSEYSSVFIWANTNNPPPGFYLHSQADVGPDYHKQSSVPCIDANKCPSRGDDPSLSGARLSLSNSSTPHWLHGKHNIIAATIIEATAWENVNTESISWL